MENPARSDIVDLLDRCPGLNQQQVGERLDLEWATLTLHLERLSQARLVVVRAGERRGELLCFLARDELLWHDDHTRILYGQAATRRVALRLVDDGPSSAQEIANDLERSVRRVREHLVRLRDHELALKARTGNDVLYFPTARLLAWADDVAQGYPRPWREA